MSEISPAKKPRASNNASEKEIDRLEKQFDKFEEEVSSLNLDRMNEAKKADQEPATKLSDKQIEKNNDHYLKPKRSISSQEKFNEKFRKEFDFAKEYVNFIAENFEIIGEKIEMWTKPFPGVPAEYWEIPSNKPVWGPRYVAEQLKRCQYHRLIMNEAAPVGSEGGVTYTGAIVVDSIKNRLDANPVSTRKSFFMGANNF